MLQELKRKSLKSISIPMILCLLIAGTIFWFAAKDSFLVFMKGKTDLDSMMEETISERCVDASIYGIYDYYAYTTERQKNGTTTTTGKNYIIPYGEYAYIGMAVPRRHIEACDDLMEATWDVLDGKADTIPEEKELFLHGTIRPMDEKQLRYYKEYLEWDTLSGETQALFLPYYLDVDVIGETHFASFYLLCASIVVLIFAAVLFLTKALTGGYQKSITTYIKNSPAGADAATAKLELFYNSCQPFFRIRMNSEFLMFQEGAKTILIPASDLLWAYQQTTTHRTNGIKTGTSYSILLKTRKGKMYSTAVGNTLDSCQEFLHILHQKMPHVILGYTKEWNKMYSKNRGQMIEISDEILRSFQGASASQESQPFQQSQEFQEQNLQETVPDDDPFASVLNRKR